MLTSNLKIDLEFLLEALVALEAISLSRGDLRLQQFRLFHIIISIGI